jgi:carbon-monoxide dehydrogenase medium subunit
MYSADFDYYRAGSVTEAGELLKTHPGAKLLAGGHSLIPLLKLRLAAPEAVIDIGRIAELRGISVSDGVVRIGSLTTHADLAGSADVQRHAAALAEAATQIGDPAVRNRGTVGGNVAHADPASDLPTVLCALGASLRMTGPGGERTVAASEFFQGVMTTSLGADELLTSIDVPVAQAGQGSAYAKFAHPASRYAVVGVAACLTVAGGSCTDASVAVGGVVPAPTRATSVEQALVGQTLSAEAIGKAAQSVGGDLGDDAELLGDIFASAEYRKAVTHVWVQRAVTAAAGRAG